MNFRQLEAFRAVMISGSITDAGKLLKVSQPSVSRLVAELERSIGLRLFERRAGRITPTPEALTFYDEVERSFVGIDQLHESARDIRNLRSARLRIAAMPSLCFGLVPEAITRLTHQYPEIKATVQTRSSQRVVNWMQSQQFDVGLAAPPFDKGGIKCLLSVSTPYVCAMSPANARAAQRRILLSQLDGETLIVTTREQATRHRLEQLFEQRKVEPVLRIESSLSYVACLLAEANLGIALVDPFTATKFAKSTLKVCPLQADVSFRFGVLIPKEHEQSKVARAFVEHLHEVLKGLKLLGNIKPLVTRHF